MVIICTRSQYHSPESLYRLFGQKPARNASGIKRFLVVVVHINVSGSRLFLIEYNAAAESLQQLQER